MTTITWTVTAMDCYPQEGGNTDVVFTVHWTCSGTDGTYNGSVYSTCSVPLTAGTLHPTHNLLNLKYWVGFMLTALTRLLLKRLWASRLQTK